MTIRTRFAPSPTGTLHLGNVRTALFAWAYARHHGGQFILRIEDTDLDRSSDSSAEGIVRDLRWLGLDWDEGPYFQMQRMDRYRAMIAHMLESGLAYRCYMSNEALDALRESQKAAGLKPKYDGRWRPENLAPGQTPPEGVKPVIRFKNPTQGEVAWDDAVKGRIVISNDELDDLVIARPDGTPTYNFCVVVDDIDMAITHVVRGDGHVNNTPRQINIFRALGKEPPVFAHLPTVLGPDGDKLSKRHGATGLIEYAEQGYLPEGVINGLARMGFAHGNDEVFTPQQLVEWFELTAVNPSPARYDAAKFMWFNQEHMKRASKQALAARLLEFMPKATGASDAPSIEDVAELYRDRAPTLQDLAAATQFFFETPAYTDELKVQHIAPNGSLFEAVSARLTTVNWERADIATALKACQTELGLKPPQIFMPLRAVLCGTTASPAVDAVIRLLGRATTLRRLASG